MPVTILGILPPAWILVALLGALWASFAATLYPLRARPFLRSLAAAIIGAAVGDTLGLAFGITTLSVGDVQVLSVSLGAVLAILIVRRPVA
ncbi:MAG TPA: hypothetical protein VKX96_01090 [Chloroflexota bacterium]|nr:hypothetical protein [Chloroflexota bacterium]